MAGFLAQETGPSRSINVLRKGAKRKHMPIGAHIITTAVTAARVREDTLYRRLWS